MDRVRVDRVFLILIICFLNVHKGFAKSNLKKIVNGGTRFSEGTRVDPEIYMNVTQLITSKGYPCEEYEVYTTDGYILSIQRIPHGYHKHRHDGSLIKPVVLLQHGLLSSSADWVSNLANQSVGFLLADAGFDVWLANSRGNTYGLKHTSLNPDQEAFWNFTWDEMAAYDLPATVNKVLMVSRQSSLVYIGYSQGSQIGFAELSTNKKLASQIKLFIALAPVAYIEHIESPISLLAPFAYDISLLLSVFGVKDFFPSNGITRWLARYVCGFELPNILCENILFVFGGYDFKYMNASRIPVYVAHSPAGTSTRNIIHYAQSIRSGRFQKFDFGKEGNLRHYNQTTPPRYKPENIPVPIALYSGTADWLSVPRDIMTLRPKLKHVVRQRIVQDWEHLDFVWAINGPTACYDDVIQLIRLYNNLY